MAWRVGFAPAVHVYSLGKDAARELAPWEER